MDGIEPLGPDIPPEEMAQQRQEREQEERRRLRRRNTEIINRFLARLQPPVEYFRIRASDFLRPGGVFLAIITSIFLTLLWLAIYDTWTQFDQQPQQPYSWLTNVWSRVYNLFYR